MRKLLDVLYLSTALAVSQAAGVTLHAYGVIRHVSAAWMAVGLFAAVAAVVAWFTTKRKGE